MELTVHIDELAFGGDGVGRLPSGKVIFVRGAAPGELLSVRVLEEKSSHVRAVTEQVLRPSLERCEPGCSVAGQCGGCSWMHLTAEAQRSWKRKLLARELLRASVITDEAAVAGMASGLELGYRIRVRLHVRGGRFGTLRARSHDVVPLRRCPVMSRPLERLALELGEHIERAPPDDADVELYVDAMGRRGLYVSQMNRSQTSTWEDLARSARVDSLCITHRKGRPGRRPASGTTLEERSLDRSLAFEPGLFVQSNREMSSRLVEEVLRVADRGGRSFAEVYAGVGHFTVHLASRFQRGAAFEQDPGAVAMLRRNLGEAATRVRAIARRDVDCVQELLAMAPIELLVVDPPRAGMKPLLSPIFSERKGLPERVVMVSCHPMSAVRDLTHLVRNAGYRLVRVLPCDLFPQTHHLELVAVLER